MLKHASRREAQPVVMQVALVLSLLLQICRSCTDIVPGSNFTSELAQLGLCANQIVLIALKSHWKVDVTDVCSAARELGFAYIGYERHGIFVLICITNCLGWRAVVRRVVGSSRCYCPLDRYSNVRRIVHLSRLASWNDVMMAACGWKAKLSSNKMVVKCDFEKAQRNALRVSVTLGIRKPVLDYDDVANASASGYLSSTLILKWMALLMIYSDAISAMRDSGCYRARCEFIPPQSIFDMWILKD